MKTIQIGIIGAGRIGRVHAENIAKFVPEMEIKTVADPYMSEETVEFLQRLRIPCLAKDADVILSDPEIKAVVVCSPMRSTPSKLRRRGRTFLWKSRWITGLSGSGRSSTR